jgi:hypothetical protein
MIAFRTRRMQAGDEQEFNEVYYGVISNNMRMWRPRPLDNMRWIWHQAPGGPADSWVIEAQDRTGWRIVGHHGLCPVRFTLGDDDWLCAKTMNSFLLPEFRDKFLYLRFERECLREADARFDATYSTAKGTARLRSALGYENYGTCIQLERGFHPLYMIYRIMGCLAGRYSYSARTRLLNALADISEVPLQKASIELMEHSASDAASSSFFADFWTEARMDAGMAPRRDAADLEWRFWKRSGFKGATLTYAWPEGGRAYMIVDTYSSPILYSLLDFFITPASPQRLDLLLDALFAWCAQRGALAIRFATSTKGMPAELMEVLYRKMKPFALQRFLPIMDLPRRISPLGRNRTNGVLADWNITEFLAVDKFS